VAWIKNLWEASMRKRDNFKKTTIGELIEKISGQFKKAKLYYGHGTDNAADEAFALVFQTLKLPFKSTPKIYKHLVAREEEKIIQKFAQRRIRERIPVPYLMHEAYFAGLPFYVDQRVLIPRSPFAELIERKFMPFIKTKSVKAILDIGTGSGCMAIAAALVFPEAKVIATDISKKTLAVAKINCKKFHVEKRVRLIHSDVWKKVPQKKYDIIMSNPPYVGDVEMASLPKEYHHEPDKALRTRENGLKIVLEILKKAKSYLSTHGILVVEVGNSQALLEKRCPKLPFLWLEFSHGGGGVFLLTTDQL
jgi:ribosomal protein L3 glutamine methyltransferase